MADNNTDTNEARLTIEPCGQLGLWIYIDGELMDLIHYSDLKQCDLKDETIEGIQMIYDEYRIPREEEE